MEDSTRYNNIGKTFSTISLDLSSAFNLLKKDVLFLKLQKLRIGDDVTSLIISFLTDRTQHVRINKTLALPRKIEICTHQGSSLSPLIFLCLLSNINNDIGDEDEKLYQFADDINLVAIRDKEENVKRKINN